jgi:23S rRNA (adenine2503-C2)-methyltransferase
MPDTQSTEDSVTLSTTSCGVLNNESGAVKTSLVGFSPEKLQALAQELSEPSFRAKQLHQWIYVQCVRDFELMTNLKKGFREKLAARYQVGALAIARKDTSQDGTIKYLFRLSDGKVIESVLMYFEDRDTYALCISTQVGCAVNCDFCATGKLGFSRHLTVAEIVDQYLYAQHDSQQEIRNIVFMGQGEPLLNYDNLMEAIFILNRSAEVGMRHITVSTAGIVPKIYDLAQQNLQITLAVSLHAADDETRERIMPINQKWPLNSLMPALHHYVDTTHRRLTIEYILLAGINDRTEDANRLGHLLGGLKCNVNLIPYNPIHQDSVYERPSRNAIYRFRDVLGTYGKKVTLRVERGVDIAAACGQLANQYSQ